MSFLNDGKEVIYYLKELYQILSVIPSRSASLCYQRALIKSMLLLVIHIPSALGILAAIVSAWEVVTKMVMVSVVVSVDMSHAITRFVIHTIKERFSVVILVRNDLVAILV